MKETLHRKHVRPDIRISDGDLREVEEGPTTLIGQERAARALQFGMKVDGTGFNVFVSGPTGIGKMDLVEEYVRKVAAERQTPNDLLFVYNHTDPYRPRLLVLPPDKGNAFADDMAEVRSFLETDVPAIFEADEYNERREQALSQLREQGETASDEIQKKAEEYGFTMQQTLMGTALVPLKDGKPMSNDELQQLSEDEQADIQRRKQELQEQISSAQKRYRKVNKEAKKKIDELDRQIVANHLAGSLEDLHDDYGEYSGVNDYLEALKDDVLDNVETLKQQNTEGQNVPAQIQQQLQAQKKQFFSRFEVNVVVDNGETDGTPVVVERNPTYSNLVGTIEKEMQMGALTTDFTMVKAGSILRANGGFLLLPLEDLLRNPYGWDALKRSLDSGELQIEELQQQLGLMSVKSLKPQPVPLETKVVLVGDPSLFSLLHAYDKGFRELFKVRADLDTRMDDTDANRASLAVALRRFAHEEELGELSADALSRLIQHAARESGHQKRLSVQMESLHDVLREASVWARSDNGGHVESDHVERALEERIYRSGLIRDKILELIEDGTILIDTEDTREGQVNGLSVIAPGEILFGRPMRITASVGPGREGVVDIERKTELGGPVHNKGVLIISGYLSRLPGGRPLGINAHLVFEQSYAQVEGDSASLAELVALLSALAAVPLRQDIALTGSVNQHGDVQSIGGVNEKIEGFYDLCAATGLTGSQGVMIPHSNVQNLMLRPDVADAIDEGQFHVWSVTSVDDAIELLSDTSMDEVRDAIAKRLEELNRATRGMHADGSGDTER